MKIELVSGITLESKPTQVLLENLTIQKRIKRSLIGFVTCLTAAMFSVLIPVFHFVFVPLFLFLSIPVALYRYKQFIRIKLQEFTCPECHKNFKNKDIYSGDNSIRLYCLECHQFFRIIV